MTIDNIIYSELEKRLVQDSQISLCSGLDDILSNLHLSDPVSSNKGKDFLQDKYRSQMSAVKNVDYNDSDVALGYAVHYMPKNSAKIISCMSQLAKQDLVPKNAYVLDVGSATGTTYFGLRHFYSVLNDVMVDFKRVENYGGEVVSIDKYTENLDMLNKIKAQLGFSKINGTHSLHMDISRQGIKSNPFNLIFMSNMLNELNSNQIKITLDNVLKHMSDDGSLIVIETSDKSGFNALSKVRALAPNHGFNVYAPNAIWTPGCESLNCNYCYFLGTDTQGLSSVRVNKDVKFPYFIFRKDNKTLFDSELVSGIKGYTKLSDAVPGTIAHVAFYQLNSYFPGLTHTRPPSNKKEPYHVYNICDGSTGMDVCAFAVSMWDERSKHFTSLKDHDDVGISNVSVENNVLKSQWGPSKHRINLFLTDKSQIWPGSGRYCL